MLWSETEFIAATNGTPSGGAHGRNWHASGLSIDSRTLAKGEVFIALKGEAYDGHDFIGSAAKRGAVAACVQNPSQDSLPQIQVEDTLLGLHHLAVAARERSGAKRIAITGSVGKTSLRYMCERVLSAHGKCHATLGNLNNHIGAPLSLARMEKESRFGVFELGMNHAGEIAELSRLVKPDYAVITQIAESHIGNFASLEDIARAKAEIFLGLNQGGVALLNADDEFASLLHEEAKSAETIITIGKSDNATYRLISVERSPQGLQIEAKVKGEAIAFTIASFASHAAMTALFALAIADCEQLNRAKSIKALATIKDLPGRGQYHDLTLKDGRKITLIDDSYNASPASMVAALNDLADSHVKGRRVAILADMLELGDKSAALHKQLAQTILETKPDLLITFGDAMQHLTHALANSPINTITCNNPQTASETALKNLQDGDVVLIKGSHGMRAHELVQNLINGGVTNAT